MLVLEIGDLFFKRVDRFGMAVVILKIVVEKFLLEQMEGESDDDHLTRVKTIKEFWDHKDNNDGIAA